MSLEIYMSVTGERQGQLTGSGGNDEGKWISVLSFSHTIAAPHDQASGLSSGKRQHKPVVITKSIDAASHQLYQAQITHETLTSVVIEFVDTSADGREHVVETVDLEDASIISLSFASRGGTPCNLITLDYGAISHNGVPVQVLPLHFGLAQGPGATAVGSA